MAGRIMVIAGKESFMVRALVKKIKDSGFEAVVVKDDVNSVHAAWDSADVYTYYLETSEKVNMKLITFMKDQLSATGSKLVLIGEKSDAGIVREKMNPSLILETFLRPLDTSKYIQKVGDYLAKGKDNASEKKSVMIVDDDPTYMGLIRGWLKDEYNVIMAASGAQALSNLALKHVDLILLDYEMPVVDGSQVLEMLRSDKTYAKIPVFFLTGKSDKESVMKVLEMKPDNYVLKTVEREDLLMMLRKFFMGM